jgi:alpha-L-fucosidase
MYDPHCTHFSWNQYEAHVKNFGHPSVTGYLDLLPLWKAEKWDPGKLMRLFRQAGARYFMAMGCHHDNFDCYNSKYQPWNSVNMGPKKDIVGLWQREAEKYGMPFGVSIHSDYTWWWWQSAFCSDSEGPLKGVPYDAAQNLSGKGTWWEGYDRKDLYGIDMSNEAEGDGDLRRDHFNHMPLRLKHKKNIEFLHRFAQKWYNRVIDLIDRYHPDMLYFDGAKEDSYPFSGVLTGRGMRSDACERVAAHLYNSTVKRKGYNDAILTLKTEKGSAVLLDFESHFDDYIRPRPWQQDITIGEWFYKSGYTYNTKAVISQLLEVVSRNGSLLLNLMISPEGELEGAGEKLLEELGQWMDICGEGIYDTVPWIKCSEGRYTVPMGNLQNTVLEFTQEDFRFTRKENVVYAFCMSVPKSDVLIKSFKNFYGGDTDWGKEVLSVEIPGGKIKPRYRQDNEGLHIEHPGEYPGGYPTDHVVCFKVAFRLN